MKPKPLIETGHIIACLQGDRPKFLCRESRRGHYVVTLDRAKAQAFDDAGEATQALEAFERTAGGWKKADGWKVWRVSTRTTFDEVAAGS